MTQLVADKAPSAMKVYFSPTMLSLLGLGFACGLPSMYKLLGSTLQVWLGDAGYGLSVAGLIAITGLPFTVHFAIAPVLDRFHPPVFAKMGRRRGWTLWVQIFLVVGIFLMGFLGPSGKSLDIVPLFVMAFIVACFAATQDCVVDAYRTDVCEPAERGAGAAIFVNGYRMAMLAAGGGALWLSQLGMSWNAVYMLMAGVMSLGVIATVMAPIPKADSIGPTTMREAVAEPVIDFFGSRTVVASVAVLLFAVLFKLPDAMANQMTTPLLIGPKSLGFAKGDIANIREWLGMAFTLVGALIGGWVVAKAGIWRSLWVFGALQALTNLGWVWLAYTGKVKWVLTLVVSFENLAAGMVAAGLIAFIMTQCNRKYSAMQYALFTSLMAGGNVLSAMFTGYFVEAMGFVPFFLLTVAAAVPGLALLPLLKKVPGEAVVVEEPVEAVEVEKGVGAGTVRVSPQG
jgi:MFS transporter, PAT family, beta-lactamase induction signal transducer AmpG